MLSIFCHMTVFLFRADFSFHDFFLTETPTPTPKQQIQTRNQPNYVFHSMTFFGWGFPLYGIREDLFYLQAFTASS